mmetsp:Transcript_12975/g.18156  ORF Transcript_12975/g.18156 Transcript_12975/m.18156 type:complete len:244 (+) Transcript_12975:395-1126(+)
MNSAGVDLRERNKHVHTKQHLDDKCNFRAFVLKTIHSEGRQQHHTKSKRQWELTHGKGTRWHPKEMLSWGMWKNQKDNPNFAKDAHTQHEMLPSKRRRKRSTQFKTRKTLSIQNPNSTLAATPIELSSPPSYSKKRSLQQKYIAKILFLCYTFLLVTKVVVTAATTTPTLEPLLQTTMITTTQTSSLPQQTRHSLLVSPTPGPLEDGITFGEKKVEGRDEVEQSQTMQFTHTKQKHFSPITKL